MKEITLELRNNNKLEKKWVLERNKKYILGRSDKVDIVIEESTASRKHAQITVLAGGSASIQDLDSANGTFVDGKQVGANQMVILRKDSQIQIGEMKSVLVVKEKIIETDDEEEEEEEVVQPKKTKNEKEKAKNKDRRSRSKSPKKSKNKGEDSRSRSRSNEKEEIGSRKGAAAFEAYKAKPTIKLPNKNKDKAQPQKAPAQQPSASTGVIQDIGLEDEEETHKFMKLMGVKDPKNLNLNDSKHLPGLKYLQKDVKKFTQQTAQMHQDLEDQFEKGLMQRGFGKRGLGAQ